MLGKLVKVGLLLFCLLVIYMCIVSTAINKEYNSRMATQTETTQDATVEND